MIIYLGKEYGLKGDNIKYVAKHLTLCRKHNSADRIVVYVDDQDYHAGVQQRLITAYPIKKVTDQSPKDLDFVLVPQGLHAKDIVNDINRTVDDYRQQHPEILVDDDDLTPDTAPDSDTDTDEEEPKTIDWSTYIVIGLAVVAVIVILLWDRKRK